MAITRYSFRTHLVQPILMAVLTAPLLFGCASQRTTNYTVAQALAVPDDTKVVVTGALVQQMDKTHLLLRDETGQINVIVDSDILGEVKFAPDAHLRIYGEIDRNSERSLLVARSVQVLN